MRTHYDNLHISEKASPEVVRAAYKALAQKWHPDKHPDHREKAERYFKIINNAFDVLSDPKSRAMYDAWLSAQRDTAPRQPEPKPKPEPAQEKPQQSRHQQNMAEAWADGKRSREQGFKEKDCPYSGDLAKAWMQGFGVRLTPKSHNGVHPWRRYFARFIDTLTLSFGSAFIVSFLAAFLVGVDLNAYWSGALLPWFVIGVVGLISIETLLIHLFATTPGKWLFGVHVYFNDGTKLSLNNSFERALGVCFVGQAACIPLISVISNLIAYRGLLKTGSTFWDERSKSTVECTPISTGRIIICVLFTLIAMATNSALLNVQMKEPPKPALAERNQLPLQPAKQVNLFDDLEPGKIQPQPSSQPQPSLDADEIHFQKIRALHPDLNSIASDPVFLAWKSSDSERMRVADSGTADEVITLLSAYKAQRSTQHHAQKAPAPQGRGSYPNCVIYQTMTDADYAACGITPPGQ